MRLGRHRQRRVGVEHGPHQRRPRAPAADDEGEVSFWPVRVVMTLLVRDEADIVDLNLAYHLARGVDAVS